MTSDSLPLKNGSPHTHLISEFNYLKIIALFLLLLVHCDLVFSHPDIMHPVQWVLLSAFFFISGYLAYESFQKREYSLRRFFKSKFKTLYLPFVVAAVFYFALQAIGTPTDPLQLVSHVLMLNIFDAINTVYNWSSLWFIPYLLLYMLIICLMEKYIPSLKLQVTALSALWIITLMLFALNSPLRLGLIFNQFIFIFVSGFYIHKFDLYEKILNYKTALLLLPLIIFFCFDLSSLFNYATPLDTLVALLYLNARSILLTFGLVLLTLYTIRKLGLPKNGFSKQIATRSAFIYLSEPFISFLILNYVFGQTDNVLFASGALFYLYIVVRVIVLFIFVPLVFILWGKFRPKRSSNG
jgi:hypothetical protein